MNPIRARGAIPACFTIASLCLQVCLFGFFVTTKTLVFISLPKGWPTLKTRFRRQQCRVGYDRLSEYAVNYGTMSDCPATLTYVFQGRQIKRVNSVA